MQKTDRAAAAVVAGIAAGAFTLSYEALRAVHVDSTGSHDLSIIYPLIVEGFVTVAVWVAFRLRDYGWKATAYPWALASLFFAYSLWANSMPETVPGYVTRGVPSLAVPLAVHLFTHMVKRREPVGAALAAEKAPEGLALAEEDEALSDEPWPEWELPAIEKAPANAADLYAVDEETGTRSVFAETASKAGPVAVHASTDSGPIIRAWARQNGFEVKDTGRIPDHVMKAFAAAHDGGRLVNA